MNTRPAWMARIEYTGPTTDDAEAVAMRLLEQVGGDSAAHGPGHVTITRTLPHDDGYESGAASVDSLTYCSAPAGWGITAVEVQREDLLDAELARPIIPPLVGITEAAEILGVTRQRAHAIAQGPTFPRPVAELASGPVYLETAVKAFAEIPRRAGRPAAAS